MSQMDTSCYGLSQSIQVQLLCFSSHSQMSHPACTLRQLVKESQKPCLGWSTTETKQRQRGAEEISHWKAASEFNLLTKRRLKTRTHCWTRQGDYSHNSSYSCGQGNKGSSDLRPENHLNIKMDISPSVSCAVCCFSKRSAGRITAKPPKLSTRCRPLINLS